MKKVIHRSDERGKGEHGWLSTRYSFSFADWHEPARMGFGMLRVINDDTIAPNSGFGMHSHRDMEIITLVMSGTVTHKDSMGNTGTVPAGDVQVMSAGIGVTHSEYNASSEVSLSLFQIWIQPKELGVAPAYGQKSFGLTRAHAGITLLVAPYGSAEGLPIHQDAYISYAVLESGKSTDYVLKEKGNGIYIFVIEGVISLEGETLTARDAIGISETGTLTLSASVAAKALIIEVPLLGY